MIRIQVQHISKTFDIGFTKRRGFLNRLATFFSGRNATKHITVLDDISFEVSSGEVLGIIGSNGSGKSTLLRTIAGIYHPNSGTVTTHGKIVSIINLGVGLKERLTMRENIFLVGSLFGMNQRMIVDQFNNIVEFSELQSFVDTKLFQFSAGMIQRLAFSIAIHASPDILLLDEVFEVGDENFRKKSSARIKELVHHGAAVLLISHDLDIVEKNCTRAIWINHSILMKEGSVHEVTTLYNTSNLSS